MKKKLFSILLCAALVFAMAVPAFAASSATLDRLSFRAYNGQGDYLNAWGNAVAKNTPIRLYSYTGNDSQLWRLYQASDGTYSLRCCANTSLAINRSDTTNNAILWTWADGRTDSDMRYYCYDNGTRYRFVLIDGNQYLTALDTTTGSYVNFQSYTTTPADWKKM